MKARPLTTRAGLSLIWYAMVRVVNGLAFIAEGQPAQVFDRAIPVSHREIVAFHSLRLWGGGKAASVWFQTVSAIGAEKRS